MYDRDIAAQPYAKDALATFMAKVYGWMFTGLVITAIVSLVVATNDHLMKNLLTPGVMIVLILLQLGAVLGLSALIHKISYGVAGAIFLAYSGLTGLTFAFIFQIYTAGSIAGTFFITAATFGGMSLYGFTTKRDLTTVGNLAFMGLIGIILASVVNWFIGSSMLYWIVTYVGVAIFIALIAYDTQKLKRIGRQYALEHGDSMGKVALMGALSLYLDFINLFILLLRIFGSRR